MELLAYLDPGSASALLAAVLAAIASAGAVVRTYGKKIKNALMFWKKDEPVADGATTTSTGTPGATAATDRTDDKPAKQ